jgi:hypothetical protein
LLLFLFGKKRYENHVGDAGAKALAAALASVGGSGLRELYLWGNQVGNEGGKPNTRQGMQIFEWLVVERFFVFVRQTQTLLKINQFNLETYKYSSLVVCFSAS